MSKQWAILDRRLRKKALNAPPPMDPRPPILSYTRLQHLQNQARGQNISIYDTDKNLPDAVREDLEEEWWYILDDTFKKIEERFRCGKCGLMHDIERVWKGLDEVRVEMESRDVEIIDGEMMQKWRDILDGIEKSYWETAVSEGCGEEGGIQDKSNLGLARDQEVVKTHGADHGVEVDGIDEIQGQLIDSAERVEDCGIKQVESEGDFDER